MLRGVFGEAGVEGGELGDLEVIAGGLSGALKSEGASDEDDELVHEVGVFHHVGGANHRATGIGEGAEEFDQLKFGGGIES